MADPTIDIFYIYLIIAGTSAIASWYAWRNYAVHRDFYRDSLSIARASEVDTKEYYTKRSLVEQKRADDAEMYNLNRLGLEVQKLDVERGKLHQEEEKVKIEREKLEERRRESGNGNGGKQ